MDNPKLFTGITSREVALAVWDLPKIAPVGVTATVAQVGHADQRGYAGMSLRELRQLLRRGDFFIQRDHLRREDLAGFTVEDAASLDAAMMDHSEEHWYARAAAIGLPIEVGTGEGDDSRELRSRIKTAERAGDRVVAASYWMGTRMRDGNNALEARSVEWSVRLLGELGFAGRIRAHNCDWLSSSQIRLLRDYGVSSINVAPQVGWETTTAYCRRIGWDSDEVKQWREATLADERYRRWGPDWTYGGHYTIETSLDHLARNEHRHAVTKHIADFLCEAASWMS